VLQKAELSGQADSENNLGGSSETYVFQDSPIARQIRDWPRMTFVAIISDKCHLNCRA
jgi:hypothetical protein